MPTWILVYFIVRKRSYKMQDKAKDIIIHDGEKMKGRFILFISKNETLKNEIGKSNKKRKNVTSERERMRREREMKFVLINHCSLSLFLISNLFLRYFANNSILHRRTVNEQYKSWREINCENILI